MCCYHLLFSPWAKLRLISEARNRITYTHKVTHSTDQVCPWKVSAWSACNLLVYLSVTRWPKNNKARGAQFPAAICVSGIPPSVQLPSPVAPEPPPSNCGSKPEPAPEAPPPAVPGEGGKSSKLSNLLNGYCFHGCRYRPSPPTTSPDTPLGSEFPGITFIWPWRKLWWLTENIQVFLGMWIKLLSYPWLTHTSRGLALVSKRRTENNL